MKKRSLRLLACLGAAMLMVFCLLPKVSVKADSTVAVYRLYNRATCEHLYTTDKNERDTLFQKHGWGYEGIGWYTSTSGTPVYRLFQPGLDHHLYTTDANEIRTLTSQYGWVSDNGGNPVFYSSGEVMVYRVYNPSFRGLHHMTTDYNEYKTLPKTGWQQEGVKFYAQKLGKAVTTQYASLVGGGSGWVWPVDKTAKGAFLITSTMGTRDNPFGSGTDNHEGTDIGAVYGSKALACQNGTVTQSGANGGYGNSVTIKTTDGYSVIYGHLSKTLVNVGDEVIAGQNIGLVGSTGKSTGPHLHFEIRNSKGTLVNGLTMYPSSILKMLTYRLNA